ncbi:GntR family transcriptional regulator [Nibricoccus aquaticus]|uniref:GntR family transcriptional regulator n=1 Tax=Nibricoccus aquaticus TaxID=2576891 RepID=A0A290Q6U5_9BACT|nr:PLP-dependent aminotransferase family protein [Nibricoccus aquaticus]ATC62900.1 GntR family transcriptional regulator [Nibricoccus aquaticus]
MKKSADESALASENPVTFSALGERAQPPTIARLMTMALETPNLLSLAAGFTDNATLPVDFVRAATEAMLGNPGDREFIQYGTNQGRPRLRQLLAERLAKIEAKLDAAELSRGLFVTNGSQQALYLAMQVLGEPGDIILVDRPSYFVFLEMLTGLGLRAVSMPVDAAGKIDAPALGALLDSLASKGEMRKIRAVYFVSYFSNPSARSLDAAEKTSVAAELSARGLCIPVVEDTAYRELYYREAPAAPSVLSLPAWAKFPKLYTATLTKPFATGLKVGYGLCTDDAWLKKMLHVKGHHDFGSANFNQAILEHALVSGNYDRQLEQIRPAYERKMRALHETLVREGLPTLGWSWAEPTGGLYLWLKAPESLDTGLDSAFCRACLEAGVLYVPGELCFGDEAPKNFIRASFGVLNERDLAEAGRRFVSVVRRFV